MNQASGDPKSDQTPDLLALIKLAIRSHPAFKFVILAGGMIAVFAFVKGAFTSFTETLAAGFIMIILMILLVVFVTLTNLRQSVLRALATFMAWSIAVIFVASAVLLCASAFVSWPNTFPVTAGHVVSTAHQILTGEPTSAVAQNDAEPAPTTGNQSVRVGDFAISKAHCERMSSGEVYCYLTATNTGTDNLYLAIFANPNRAGGSYLKFGDSTRVAAKSSEIGLDKNGGSFTTDKVLAKDDIVATLKFDVSTAKPNVIAELVTVWGWKKDQFGILNRFPDPAVFHNIPVTER
jgi:membrane protein implicated in regulation of membrane protease activity